MLCCKLRFRERFFVFHSNYGASKESLHPIWTWSSTKPFSLPSRNATPYGDERCVTKNEMWSHLSSWDNEIPKVRYLKWQFWKQSNQLPEVEMPTITIKTVKEYCRPKKESNFKPKGSKICKCLGTNSWKRALYNFRGEGMGGDPHWPSVNIPCMMIRQISVTSLKTHLVKRRIPLSPRWSSTGLSSTRYWRFAC